MDEVMADTLAEHIRRYNQTFDEDCNAGRPRRQRACGK
jgi:5'(3')-deoxyribonucleotidase